MTHLRRLQAAAAALAIAALAAFAAACSSGEAAHTPGPAVAVQDDHLAVPDSDIESRLDMIAATGAKVTRVDLFWRDVAPAQPADAADPADPAYRFDRADAIMRGLAQRGITPIVAVFNTPEWAAGGLDPDVVTAYNSLPPKDPGAYGDFMEAVSTRYSGSFEDASGRRLPRVRHWEIWNEPNLSLYLTPQIGPDGSYASARTYAELVRAAYPAVKRGGGAGTTVIVGAGGPRGRTGKAAVGAFDWLAALRTANVPLDAYSQHIYPAAAPTVDTDAKPSWSSVDEILHELDTWKTGLPLFITEAGYTTKDTPFRSSHVTEEQQAEYLGDIFRLPQLQDPRVRAVVWFNLQDNANWPAGLLREDGSEKPSYDVFRKAADNPQQRSLTG
ncbi:MAG: cellulase family glycosylhydrolase [Actinomycetota bacterium]